MNSVDILEEVDSEESTFDEDLGHTFCIWCYPIGTNPEVALCGRDIRNDRWVESATEVDLCSMCVMALEENDGFCVKHG